MRTEMVPSQLLAPLPEAVRLAVVIPCRNEENYIERCVRSLLEDAYPGG